MGQDPQLPSPGKASLQSWWQCRECFWVGLRGRLKTLRLHSLACGWPGCADSHQDVVTSNFTTWGDPHVSLELLNSHTHSIKHKIAQNRTLRYPCLLLLNVHLGRLSPAISLPERSGASDKPFAQPSKLDNQLLRLTARIPDLG